MFDDTLLLGRAALAEAEVDLLKVTGGPEVPVGVLYALGKTSPTRTGGSETE